MAGQKTRSLTALESLGHYFGFETEPLIWLFPANASPVHDVGLESESKKINLLYVSPNNSYFHRNNTIYNVNIKIC